jgi:hypothetical protein
MCCKDGEKDSKSTVTRRERGRDLSMETRTEDGSDERRLLDLANRIGTGVAWVGEGKSSERKSLGGVEQR